MDYLTVKNWEEFQHYRDREPKWIKVYRSLLVDYKYDQLSDAEFGVLVKIWLLASQMENKIPNDPSWIKNRLGLVHKPNLNKYIELDFLLLQNNTEKSKKIQKCTPEIETEVETETDNIICPHQDILCLWKEILPSLTQPKQWDNDDKKLLRSRWMTSEKTQSIDWWRKLFEYVKESPFLMGEIEPKNGHQRFKLRLQWVLNKTNFKKITEGAYHN